MRLVPAALFSAFLLLLCSCTPRRAITVDADDPVSLLPGIDWAVIKEPSAAFLDAASFEGSVAGLGRKGDVLQVQGKSFVRVRRDKAYVTEVWYCFEQGWLNESMVVIYDNKLKAQTASRQLQE